MLRRTILLAGGLSAISLTAAAQNIFSPFSPNDDRRREEQRRDEDHRRFEEDRHLNERGGNREGEDRRNDNRFGNREDEDRRARDQDVARRQQQYNANIVSLQQQHNQRLLSLQQQFGQGRISRSQLDDGHRQLDEQYNQSVANEQRALPR